MKQILSLFGVLTLAVAMLFSCQKEVQPNPQALTVAEGACSEKTVTIWAGKTTNAGSMTVSNDAANVYVKIVLNAVSSFQAVTENAKLWIGDDLATLPAANCAPKNGQFPWKVSVSADQKEYTYTIPYTSIATYNSKAIDCSSKLFVVLHLSVNVNGENESAYAGDIQAVCQRWWFYTEYQGVCCLPPTPSEGYSQTAFAKGNWVFTTDPKSNPEKLPSLGLTRNRWGWAINIRPVANGRYEYPMYAGAGLNNLTKGKLVGKVIINVSGSNVSVSYSMNTGYSLTGLHVYADDLKPTTLAPGQYGYIESFDPRATSHTANFILTDTDADGLWFICHAGAYGKY